MLKIQIFLQKVLQITDIMNGYWYMKKMTLMVSLNENQ